MAKLTEAEMIARYDAERSGAAYTKPAANQDDELIGLLSDLYGEEEDAPRCTACTEALDCPACTAKYEAEREQVIARAAAAGTAKERAEILLENHETLNGDQIFDLMMEHDIAGFVWHRAIDWVLWRQAHGKPVKRCGDEDDCPAAIDARYNAARDFAANLANFSPSSSERDVGLLCAGEMIAHWERTPAEDAALAADTDLMIKILEAIDGGE